jgi:hypothetical protein
MLGRPVGCQYPKKCAIERVCLQAKNRELQAHQAHERILKAEQRETEGVVEVTSIPVARKTALEVIEEAVEEEFGPEIEFDVAE